jgi:hypothetical protein
MTLQSPTFSAAVKLALLVAFVVFTCSPRLARASQDAGTGDARAGSRQVLVGPPPGSDAAPTSVDSLELMRALSTQNDLLKNANAQLEEQVKTLEGEQAREVNDLAERLDRLKRGDDHGTGGPAGWSWTEAACLVALGLVAGLMVTRGKGSQKDE